MMTTMAALLGGLPLALGTGVGSELRRPLGITIVGGLILSQILTLYTTPVVYLAFDWLAHRFAFQVGNRFQAAVIARDDDAAISRRAFDNRLRDEPNLATTGRIHVSKRQKAANIDRTVFHLRPQIAIVFGDVKRHLLAK